MATFLFANNAQTTLAGPISNTATTCNLAAGSGVLFPQPGTGQYFAMTFLDATTRTVREIVYVTAVSGDTLTITRAQENTAAGTWNAGDIAANLVTAGTLNAFAQSANLASSFFQGTDNGSDVNNVVVPSTTPTNNGPSAGQIFIITKGAQANTGPVTIKIPLAGTQSSLVYADGSALAAGDWPGNSGMIVRFTGGLYQVVGRLLAYSLLHTGNDTSGTPNQIVASMSPAITAYQAGHRYEIKLANNITGPGATVTLNGLGTSRTLKRADGSDVQKNDGLAGQVIDVVDLGDGSTVQIIGLRTSFLPGTGRVYLFASQTFTVPAYVTSLKQVQGWAPGGGGGGSIGSNGAGSGGGPGGWDQAFNVPVTPGQQIPATLGTPGAGGASANGGAGGMMSFGSIISATGGGPGGLGSNGLQTQGAGAAGAGANVPAQVKGSQGGTAFIAGQPCGGLGGAAIFGGGTPGLNVGTAGSNGLFPGGGGNGGAVGGNGGAGAAGMIIIDY